MTIGGYKRLSSIVFFLYMFTMMPAVKLFKFLNSEKMYKRRIDG